jgi:UDP-2,4-diacetamido-2,4,6-trideoxy-beta-L-altropyranose hydrolase
MTSNVVLIRADGNKSVGMGHLSRACLISNMLRGRFALNPKLITKRNQSVEYFIRQRGVETILLPESISEGEEIELLSQIAETEKPLLFVLDVLEQDINTSYMKAVKISGCPVIAITDDSNHRVIDADLIINGNPNQLDQDYSRESGRYLLGPMFFLMDSAYGNIEVKEPGGDIERILLTFGGSDHNNLLFRVLNSLEKMNRKLSVLVITSKASEYVERLQEYLKQLTIPTECFVDVDSLAPFWERCDLAITAAGNTLFERIAVRLPGATLCQLYRQMEIADYFESLYVNVNLGFGQNISDHVLYKRISDFIDDNKRHRLQYQETQKVLDGNGLNRLKNEVQSLLKVYYDELRRTGRTT